MIRITKSYTLCQEILKINDRSAISIVNTLIRCGNQNKSIFLGQKEIARRSGCCEKTVNSWVKKFHDLGYIEKIRRPYTSNMYKLSQTFYDYAHILKRKFKSLAKMIPATFVANIFFLPIDVFVEKVTEKIAPILQSSYGLISHVFSTLSYNIGESLFKTPNFIPDRVILNKISKKRKLMTEFKPCPELLAITKYLNLTKWGQIELSPFSGVVLGQALKSMEKLSNKPNKPVEWIFMAAKTISESHAIPINWDIRYALKEKYNMPKNAHFILPKKINSTVNPEIYMTTRKKDAQENEARKIRNAQDPIKSKMQQEFEKMLAPLITLTKELCA